MTDPEELYTERLFSNERYDFENRKPKYSMKKKIYIAFVLADVLGILCTTGILHVTLILVSTFGVFYFILHNLVKRISWGENTEFSNQEKEPQNID